MKAELKPEELKIGNRVNCLYSLPTEKFNVPVIIAAIHADYVVLSTGEQVEIEFLSGIELSEEWLKKAGFEHEGGEGYKAPNNTEHWYFTLRNGFMPNSIARGSIKSDKYIGCKYVHQLQNLYYALTGNELIFNHG